MEKRRREIAIFIMRRDSANARTAIVIIVRDENFNKLKAKGYTATYIIHDRCESAVYIRTRA